ncbi:DUF2225 domain-containing protein [Paenibacillus sp. CC-CFT747]|nr:DUF2225 domain-containing protein [Paenibacillus sp. CC-CFT747]
MLEPLYQTKNTCLVCEREFTTSRVRSSFKRPVRTESDFYMVFKEINPDYYVVAVCPSCGYASTENFHPQLAPVHRAALQEKVGRNWSFRDYGGSRTWEDALATYKLALVCAQAKQEKDRVIAGLLHHIAWLYREKEDHAQEQRFLAFAMQAYLSVYEREGGSVNNARLMYLLGELNRRLGRYSEAVQWFSRVVNDKSIMDAAMIRASRDQWEVTRQDMAAKAEES